MCIIAYKPKKATITKRMLRNCWDNNPDGGGYMFSHNGKLIIKKGFFAFRRFYQSYRKDERRYDGNFVLHFRIATHGKISKTNTHPFYVNKNLGFAHNGILHCVDVPKDSIKSDTMIFIKQVLQKYPDGFLNEQCYHISLEGIAKAESSKFIFLDDRDIVQIINEKAGVWHNGIWFSNDGYKDILSQQQDWESYTNKVYGVEGWAECYYCGNSVPEDEIRQDLCYEQNCCAECFEQLEDEFLQTIPL